MASTFASRVRRPAPEPEPPAIERPGGGWRLWSLVPVSLAFALFGAVVWLAYQDASLAPPVGEPPLIKAAPEPIKLPPDETEETTLSGEDGTVGRLWSDAGQVDQPERLLPTPEAPMSPPAVEEPATAAGTIEPPASAPAAAERAVQATGAEATGAGVPASPAQPADASQSGAAPAAGEESWQEAEAALDRLLAEVTAMSDDTDAPAATATAPAEDRASIEPPAQRQVGAASAPAETAAASEPPATAPAETAASPEPPATTPADRAPVPRPEVRPAPRPESTEVVAATPPQAATPRIPIAPDGDFRIQLAAVRGEADARRAWQLFMGDLGPVLADVEPIFERADTANGVFYRVQVGPFASQEAADTLCEQLKQRNASCFVIRR
jgi:hypothetical protein